MKAVILMMNMEDDLKLSWSKFTIFKLWKILKLNL